MSTRQPFLSFSHVLTLLLFLGPSSLDAGEVRQVFPEVELQGDEMPFAHHEKASLEAIPPPSRTSQVGSVVDSTTYDHQSNATLYQRIAAVGDSALHATAIISPDALFTERGMKYYYYQDGVFTDYGYVEGTGLGNQRGGFGSVVSYDVPELGIGNIAVMTSHTNLAGRPFGMHWYSFMDASQGSGTFTATEGPPGTGSDVCDAFLWPSLYITNDITGHMAMVGMTFSAICSGGFDDIKVTHKTRADAAWGTPLLLDTLDDPGAWNVDPNIPMLAGADNGLMCVVSCDWGTNMYLWASFDGGVIWSDRVNISGYPTGPHNVPPDSTSTEYRPLQNNAIAVSPGGIPHVVWTEYQARGDADSIYTPGVSGLYQYRTRLRHWDPVHGLSTVYRHPAGIADLAHGTTFAYNVGHPVIGFGETEDIVFVVYEGFVDADQDPSNLIYFGDIYVSVSTDGGATWVDRVNVTASPGSDDLYPSIARTNPQGVIQELPGYSVGNPDGVNDFVMIYQNDDVAGTWVRAEEPVVNFDMMLVAPVDFEALGPPLVIDIEPVNGTVFEPGDWIIYAVTLTNTSSSPILVTASTYASNVADWRLNLFGPVTFTIQAETTIGPVNLQNRVPLSAPPMTAYICAEANEVHDCYQVTIQ